MNVMEQAHVWKLLGEVTQSFAAIAPSIDAQEKFNTLLDQARQLVSGENGGTLIKGAVHPTRPKVFCGLPHHAGVHWETARTILQRYSEDKVDLTLEDCQTSLLAHGFNRLFCSWLNAGLCEYFLLLHADIGFPTDWIIDVLIRDLEAGKNGRSFHAIHAPMAMKDERGCISTALGSASNPWHNKRRLTSTELMNLPEVFDIDDLVTEMSKGGPIPPNPVFCPNTGVLLIKRAEWCWDFPGFEIRDKIVHRTRNGTRTAEPVNLSEDWNFGQWAAKHGVYVGGTRNVKTLHYHPNTAYGNFQAWGNPTDQDYANNLPLGGANEDCFEDDLTESAALVHANLDRVRKVATASENGRGQAEPIPAVPTPGKEGEPRPSVEPGKPERVSRLGGKRTKQNPAGLITKGQRKAVKHG